MVQVSTTYQYQYKYMARHSPTGLLCYADDWEGTTEALNPSAVRFANLRRKTPQQTREPVYLEVQDTQMASELALVRAPRHGQQCGMTMG